MNEVFPRDGTNFKLTHLKSFSVLTFKPSYIARNIVIIEYCLFFNRLF